jgi:hypothetical protein
MSICIHKSISCLNQFELIRKYQCASCSGVMMCACEKEFATRYLSHQIQYGRHSDSQEEVEVTLGFQKNVCRACRGLPAETHSAAPIPGRPSKITRYYWHEIAFETIPRFAEWAKQQSYSDWLDALLTHKDKYRSFEKDVINEMKELHNRFPKYIYKDTPQNEILAQYNVEVVRLNGTYVKDLEIEAIRRFNVFGAASCRSRSRSACTSWTVTVRSRGDWLGQEISRNRTKPMISCRYARCVCGFRRRLIHSSNSSAIDE